MLNIDKFIAALNLFTAINLFTAATQSPAGYNPIESLIQLLHSTNSYLLRHFGQPCVFAQGKKCH